VIQFCSAVLLRLARKRLRLTHIFSLALLPVSLAHAQGTRVWTQSHYEEFEKGTPKGVAISSEGYLEAGPSLKQLAATGTTYVWSIAAGAHGDIYAGTGSPARVLQIGADGKQTTLFESKDLSVQVVRVGTDGSIYAATLPSGKVYRFKPGQGKVDESKADVVFDPATAESKPDDRPKYLWDMAFDGQGRLYIATGAPAAIYRVANTPGAKPEKFFSSDEQHIRCLLVEKDGSLIAGTDNGGLVYRIDRDGKGIVIYDAPKAEITALAESASGILYIAAVGEKNKNNLPPLPVQGNTSVMATITIVQPGSIQASNSNGLIPDGSEVYEISREGAPRKLWSAREDVIYALAATPAGLLAATGNRGHVYRVQEDGSVADIAHVEASQATAFADAPEGIYLGASNSGKVLSLKSDPRTESSYESEVFDAGFFSQFGQPEIDATGGNRYELSVRTGNIDNPARGWGEWQRVTTGDAALKLTSGRFVQWKVVLHQGSGRLESVGIHYLPVNVAPVVDEIVVAPGARVSAQAMQQPVPQQIQINFPSAQNNNFINLTPEGPNGPLVAFKDRTAITIRWAAHDDNGDDLSFRIYFKGEGEQNWLLLKDRTRERYLSFDAVHLPDGIYRLKVVASDLPSHTEGEAKTGDRISDRFTVDTTPPLIENMTAASAGDKLHITLSVKDAMSTIDHAEYSVDAGRWLYLEPVGKLSDAKEEHYDFTASVPPPDAGDDEANDDVSGKSNEKTTAAKEHVVTVRIYDHYGNVAAAKAVVH
jgi:hypothetical protein